jgi:GH35 family endo-1,4-beta-xylanase
MKAIAKSFNHFDYTQCDYVAKFAKDNNMAFRAHAAIWAKQPFMPEWIRWEKNARKIENFM